MANVSLGLITIIPGTPVRATSNLSVPTTQTPAHSYMVEAWGATGGDGYVGGSNMSKSTGVGVFGRIPRSTTTQYFYFQSTCARQNDLFEMSSVWIDGDVSGVYLVSYIEA